MGSYTTSTTNMYDKDRFHVPTVVHPSVVTQGKIRPVFIRKINAFPQRLHHRPRQPIIDVFEIGFDEKCHTCVGVDDHSVVVAFFDGQSSRCFHGRVRVQGLFVDERSIGVSFEIPNVTDIIEESQSKIYKNPSY